MDVSTITSLIGSLGFPIVCCFVLFKQNSEMQKTLSELSTTLSGFNTRLTEIEDAVKEKEGDN